MPARLSTLIICNRFDALQTISSMLSFHFILSAMNMISPSILWDDTFSRGTPLMVSGARSGLIFRGQIIISLHFFGLRFMLFSLDQEKIVSRSDYRVVVASEWMPSDNVISSTYFQWFTFKGDFKARSLIIITKRIGPSFVPCGIPAWVISQSDAAESSLTAWRLLLRKLQSSELAIF